MKCELKGLLPISVDLFVPNSSESNHQHHFRFTFRQVKRVSDHFCNPFWQSCCTSQCLARHGLILQMLLTLNCLVNVIGWGPAWLANRSWRIKDSSLPACFCYTNVSNCWELWSSTHSTSQCCDCFRANIPFRLRFWPRTQGLPAMPKRTSDSKAERPVKSAKSAPWVKRILDAAASHGLSQKDLKIHFHCQNETTSNPWLKVFKFDWLLSWSFLSWCEKI